MLRPAKKHVLISKYALISKMHLITWNMTYIFFHSVFIDDSDIDLETKMRLLSLSRIGDPDVLILAAAAGDISTMRNFLQEAPDKVLVCILCALTLFHVEGSPSPHLHPHNFIYERTWYSLLEIQSGTILSIGLEIKVFFVQPIDHTKGKRHKYSSAAFLWVLMFDIWPKTTKFYTGKD